MSEANQLQPRVRQLLVDIVNILDAYEGQTELISNQGQAMDGYSALANFVSVAKRAKSVLSNAEAHRSRAFPASE